MYTSRLFWSCSIYENSSQNNNIGDCVNIISVTTATGTDMSGIILELPACDWINHVHCWLYWWHVYINSYSVGVKTNSESKYSCFHNSQMNDKLMWSDS